MENDDSDEFKRRFGRRLQERRVAVGLSQEALGAVFGVGKGTVSAWETGRTDPGVVKLRALAQLFKTTPDTLLLDHPPSDVARAISQEVDQLAEPDRATFLALWRAYLASRPKP